MILEIGRERVDGSATDELLATAEAELLAEAMPELAPPKPASGKRANPQQGRLIL